MQNGNLKGVEAIQATQTISFSVPNQEYVSATVESSGLKKKSQASVDRLLSSKNTLEICNITISFFYFSAEVTFGHLSLIEKRS